MRTHEASVTELLPRWRQGDSQAGQRIASLVYDELRGIARSFLKREAQGHTLVPTALVHEAYVRLVGKQVPDLADRAHLLGVVARLMRQVLVNHAHARRSAKRGGGWQRGALDAAVVSIEGRGVDMVALNEALKRLEKLGPRQCRVVELRFFGALTVEETATALRVSPRTVIQDWTMARAWLRREVGRA